MSGGGGDGSSSDEVNVTKLSSMIKLAPRLLSLNRDFLLFLSFSKVNNGSSTTAIYGKGGADGGDIFSRDSEAQRTASTEEEGGGGGGDGGVMMMMVLM